MASTIFLESPKRITALMMVMTVYKFMQLWNTAFDKNSQQQTFPNQKGKPISNPTARWVFQYFTGIHVIDKIQTLVLNLNDHHIALLKLLGKPYEKIYAGFG